MELPDDDSLGDRLLLPFDHSSLLALTYHYKPVVLQPITTKTVMLRHSFLYHPFTIFMLLWMQVMQDPNALELFQWWFQFPEISHDLLFHFIILECHKQWSRLTFNQQPSLYIFSMSVASTFMSNTPLHKSNKQCIVYVSLHYILHFLFRYFVNYN